MQLTMTNELSYMIIIPQRHGQNLYKQNANTYSQELSNGDIDGYDGNFFRQKERSLSMKVVGSTTKIGLLLVQTIRVNNIGTCMV